MVFTDTVRCKGNGAGLGPGFIGGSRGRARTAAQTNIRESAIALHISSYGSLSALRMELATTELSCKVV